MEADLLKGNTPTLILAVLRDGPLHGYGIAREIERRSRNALRFRESTLYPALHALEQDGHIAAEWQLREGSRPRRVYTLTSKGHAALALRSSTSSHAPGDESYGRNGRSIWKPSSKRDGSRVKTKNRP